MKKKNSDMSRSYLFQVANQDFSKAYLKGFWRSIFSWIGQRNNELLPFDEVMKRMPLRGQHQLGFQQIDTNKIIGSVGRFQDFDREFLPLHSNIRNRWQSIDRAFYQDVILPPIEVYKIGEVYFVKDGNHRVSVARERGQRYMDAYVIQIDIPGTLESTANIDNLVLTYEYAEFLGKTRLDLLLPAVSFKFTIPGQYDKLLQHISVHRWFMGEKLNREITDEESVLGWYKSVYNPLVKIIQKHKIMEKFPERTETDLYLWIIEHRWYLAEELHKNVSLESAAMHYIRSLSTSPLKRFLQFLNSIKRRFIRIK
jgi:hypothetical protein